MAARTLTSYGRLDLVRAKQISLPVTLVQGVLLQSVEERERFCEPDLSKQFLRGMLYLQAKEMAASLQQPPQLGLDFRQ